MPAERALSFRKEIIFYFFIAFRMNVKNYILSGKRNPLWYK